CTRGADVELCIGSGCLPYFDYW
nr:immunoglobulin heavy chain junction region [Macaca mulatta]MOW78377.1 immunoglobulin heavy chain junction region [Macaca mulatta]MOW81638.1 immunoglobulin heavy chain junction region [Macaca mulatta]MOW84676.1 immunoglobulin heavy chain junction region [Macaca mulatta]